MKDDLGHAAECGADSVFCAFLASQDKIGIFFGFFPHRHAVKAKARIPGIKCIEELASQRDLRPGDHNGGPVFSHHHGLDGLMRHSSLKRKQVDQPGGVQACSRTEDPSLWKAGQAGHLPGDNIAGI